MELKRNFSKVCYGWRNARFTNYLNIFIRTALQSKFHFCLTLGAKGTLSVKPIRTHLFLLEYHLTFLFYSAEKRNRNYQNFHHDFLAPSASIALYLFRICIHSM